MLGVVCYLKGNSWQGKLSLYKPLMIWFILLGNTLILQRKQEATHIFMLILLRSNIYVYDCHYLRAKISRNALHCQEPNFMSVSIISKLIVILFGMKF
ncbi:hypothetical protein CR513_34327, partial [Mucuna pruriens]